MEWNQKGLPAKRGYFIGNLEPRVNAFLRAIAKSGQLESTLTLSKQDVSAELGAKLQDMGVLKISRPSKDAELAQVEFEKPPDDKAFEAINISLLEFSRQFSRNIDGMVSRHIAQINPSLKGKLPPVYWELKL